MISLEILILDGDKVVKRITVNEDLREEYIRRRAGDNGDMVTLWFFRVIAAIFEPVLAGTHGPPFPFIDITGASRSIRAKTPAGTTVPAHELIWNTSAGAHNRFWISVGTSDVPPSPSDFRLGNKIAEVLAARHVDESIRTITFSVGITFATDVVIREVGLEWECNVGGATTPGKMLIDRTVLPEPETVPANRTATIIYRITV
jgi:hypothetical protein